MTPVEASADPISAAEHEMEERGLSGEAGDAEAILAAFIDAVMSDRRAVDTIHHHVAQTVFAVDPAREYPTRWMLMAALVALRDMASPPHLEATR